MRAQVYLAILVFVMTATIYGQPDHPPGAPPAGAPPRPPHAMGEGGPGRGAPQPGNWMRPHDENNNGILEAEEFTAAISRTFKALDRNNNGTLEADEVRPLPMERMDRRDGAPPKPAPLLPPFFSFRPDAEPKPLSLTEFEQMARSVFADMDENGDGALTKEEAAKHLPPHPGPPPPPPAPPNAHFIGAELRFGDKKVVGQPFSADILIEETRRLFDGSLATRQTRGAVYRDTAGRTRREQPLEMVAGFPIVGGDNQPQMLVFINDFGAGSHIFLDMNNKVARKSRLGNNVAPPAVLVDRPDSKTESLGTKTLEGVTVQGTRVTFEMPAGHMGNDKPLLVTEERWYSPDLQVVVLSRHIDPIGGEHLFKLLNIKRSEPVASLFSVPSGFRFDN